MITELEEFEPAEAQRILNTIAASLLPNPGVEPARQVSADEKADRVLRALRNRVEHGKPKETDARLFALVAEELSRRYLTNEKMVEVRARLGDRGELEPVQSEVIFNPELDVTGPFFAIKRNEIKEALYSPDMVQLVTFQELGAPEGRMPLMSLRIKRHRVQSAEAHSLFIHCVHQGEKLTVWQALRIYDADVKCGSDASPLDALRAFVETYGADLIFDGNLLKRKFILYEAFSPRDPAVLDLGAENPGPAEMISRVAIVKGTLLGTFEVSFVYAIKLRLYIRGLARHGLRVDPYGTGLNALHRRVSFQQFDT